jgi:hypothetical protein
MVSNIQESEKDQVKIAKLNDSKDFYHLINGCFEKRACKPLIIVVEWDLLHDYEPEKFTYWGRTYKKNAWHSSANDLLALLFRNSCVGQVFFLIDKYDSQRKAKKEKYQQTFGKFPQSRLGFYSTHKKWIKKNAPVFDVFVGKDDNLRNEKGIFSRKNYLVPEHPLDEKERGWNVFLFDNKHESIPEAGGLTDEKIVEGAKEMRKMYGYPPFEELKEQPKKSEIKNSASPQQPVNREKTNENSSGNKRFLIAAVIIALVGLVIWFILRRNRSQGEEFE